MENLEDADCQEQPVNYSLKYSSSVELEEPVLTDIITVCDSYVETDLDQIVDYSRKYPEQDATDDTAVIRLLHPAPCRNEFPKPARNDDESKTVDKSGTEFEGNVDETPLMFSRSSSLTSLSAFEQPSPHVVTGSVSEVSYVSGSISPSELPDSPGQTMPPSPLQKDNSFFKNEQDDSPKPFLSSKALEDLTSYSGGVFDDRNSTFVVEGTPAEFSCASSLSSLSIRSDLDFAKPLLLKNVSGSEASDESRKTIIDASPSNRRNGNGSVKSSEAGSQDSCEENDDHLILRSVKAGLTKKPLVQEGSSCEPDNEFKLNQSSFPVHCKSVGPNQEESQNFLDSECDEEDDDDKLLMQCIEAGLPPKKNPTASKSYQYSVLPVKGSYISPAKATKLIVGQNVLSRTDSENSVICENFRKLSLENACDRERSANFAVPQVYSGHVIDDSQTFETGAKPLQLIERQHVDFDTGLDSAPCLISSRECMDGQGSNLVEGTPVCFSRNSSLSSLSIHASDEDDALLEDCIQMGMPKPKEKGKSLIYESANGPSCTRATTDDSVDGCKAALDKTGHDVDRNVSSLMNNLPIKENSGSGLTGETNELVHVTTSSIQKHSLVASQEADQRSCGGNLTQTFSSKVHNDPSVCEKATLGIDLDESNCHVVENTPVCFSRNSSLSSLSIASDSEQMIDQVLLNECIQLGMPKPKTAVISKESPRDGTRDLTNCTDSVINDENSCKKSQNDLDGSCSEDDEKLLLECIQAGLLKKKTKDLPGKSQQQRIHRNNSIPNECSSSGSSRVSIDRCNSSAGDCKKSTSTSKVRTDCEGHPKTSSHNDENLDYVLHRIVRDNAPDKVQSGQRNSDSSCDEEDQKLLYDCIQAGLPKKDTKGKLRTSCEKCRCKNERSGCSKTNSDCSGSPHKNYSENINMGEDAATYLLRYGKAMSSKMKSKEIQKRTQRLLNTAQPPAPVYKESSRFYGVPRRPVNTGKMYISSRGGCDIAPAKYSHSIDSMACNSMSQSHSVSSSAVASDDEMSPYEKALVEECIRMGMPKRKDKVHPNEHSGRLSSNKKKNYYPLPPNGNENVCHKDFQRSCGGVVSSSNKVINVPVQYISQPTRKSREFILAQQAQCCNGICYMKKSGYAHVPNKNLVAQLPDSRDLGAVRPAYDQSRRTLEKSRKVEVPHQKIPTAIVPDPEDIPSEKTSPEIQRFQWAMPKIKDIKNNLLWFKGKSSVKSNSFELNNNEIVQKCLVDVATQTDWSFPQLHDHPENFSRRYHLPRAMKKYV